MKKKPAWAKHQYEKPAKVTPAELTPYPEGREVMGCMSAVPITDTKQRILPWEDDDWNWSVRTRCGDLSVVRDDEHNEWLAKWIYVDDDDTIGRYPDAESAIDACESAYLARCTEFLRVAGPGEVVVPIKVAMDAHDTAISSRHFWVKFADMLARFDNAINGLSAAIDAASKE